MSTPTRRIKKFLLHISMRVESRAEWERVRHQGHRQVPAGALSGGREDGRP